MASRGCLEDGNLRSTYSVVELGATPQIKLPTSKMKIDMRKLVFNGKYVYAFPHVDWKLPRVMKYAEPYHATSSSLWNSSVIVGMAVAMMVF